MEPGLMVDLVAFLQEERTNIDSRLSDYEVSGSPRARSPFDLGSQLPGPTHCPHWRLPRPLFYIYVCVRVCVRMCVCVCVRACVCVCHDMLPCALGLPGSARSEESRGRHGAGGAAENCGV